MQMRIYALRLGDPFPFYILKPSAFMHATCLCTSSLHFSSASELSCRRKQSSLADFVSGHAQHGLRPFGLRGFCLGSDGLYGFSCDGVSPDDHHEVTFSNITENEKLEMETVL